MRNDATATRGRCVELAAEGRGPKAIADELGVSDRTVRRHLATAAVELRALQDERLATISRRALAASETALRVLEDIAEGGRVEMARVTAARVILEYGQTMVKVGDLVDRIESLEERQAAPWSPRTA